MGLPSIVPNQSLYYNQDQIRMPHGSPDTAVMRSVMGAYQDTYLSSGVQLQTEPAHSTQNDARVLMASPIPITAAGFPQNHHKIKKFSRETNYESDFSIIETEGAFPQQPSSGETMDYKYKKTQQIQLPPNQPLSYVNQISPQNYDSQYVSPVLTTFVNGQQQQNYPPYILQNMNAQAFNLGGYQSQSQNPTDLIAPYQPQIQSTTTQNQRSRAGALILQPQTQLMTVAELHTDTNNSADTMANGSNHSEKVSGRNSVKRSLIEGNRAPQSSRSDQNKAISKDNQLPSASNENQQKKRNAISFQEGEGIQIEQAEQMQSKGQEVKALSQAKRKALKQALENTGKNVNLLPLQSKPVLVSNPQLDSTNLPEQPTPTKSQSHIDFTLAATQHQESQEQFKSGVVMQSELRSRQTSSERPLENLEQEYNKDDTKNDSINNVGIIDEYTEVPPQNHEEFKTVDKAHQPMKEQVEEVKRTKVLENRQSLGTNQNHSSKHTPSQRSKQSQRLSIEKSPQNKNSQNSNNPNQISFFIEEQPQSPDQQQINVLTMPSIEEHLAAPQSPEKDIKDLVMLIGAHKTFMKDSRAQGKRAHFKKRKHDMVLREMKYVHKSSLLEERRTFVIDNEIKRDHLHGGQQNEVGHGHTRHLEPLDKIGIGSLQLLRMIPRIVSDNQQLPNQHHNHHHKSNAKNITHLKHQTGNTKVKMICERAIQTRAGNYIVKKSRSFPRLHEPQKYSCWPSTKKQFRIKDLLIKKLVEEVKQEDQDQLIFKFKRSNSYDHHIKLAAGLPNIVLGAPNTKKIEEFFPHSHHEPGNSKLSNNEDSSRIEKRDKDTTSNYGGLVNVLNPVSMGGAPLEQSNIMNRYDEGLSSLQSSIEMDHADANKFLNNGGQIKNSSSLFIGGSGAQPSLKKRPSIRPYKKMSSLRLNRPQPPPAHNNSIFTLGGNEYQKSNGTLVNGHHDLFSPSADLRSLNQGRIISKESVEDLDEQLVQEYKDTKHHINPLFRLGSFSPQKVTLVQSSTIKRQFTITVDDEETMNPQANVSPEFGVEKDNSSSLKAGIINQGTESTSNKKVIVVSKNLSKAGIQNTAKGTTRILISQQDEDIMMRDIANEDKILKFPKLFLVAKEFNNPNGIPEVLHGITPIQKAVDHNKNRLHAQMRQNSSRKSGSQVSLHVISDANLNELHQNEQKYIFLVPKRRYDVLIDPQIFNHDFYFILSAQDKRRSLFNTSSLKPLIIKFRGTIQQGEENSLEDSSEFSTVIINFLREQYLSNFSKYSRHLTQRERPISRYYNSHQVKDLAMLSMTQGGFNKEHRSLPQWKVHNNQELLHFQVAQLRRAYTYWLTRQSMNEDIKRTLFQSKAQLLLNNVRIANNSNLISPQLVEATIDKICQLCCKPEDMYKLNMILSKSGVAVQTTLATTGGGGTKTFGSSALDRSRASHQESLYDSVKTSSAQGLDETLADYNQSNQTVDAIYLHNHPAFITYNQDLEVADNLSIDSFIPMRFRMSTLFGYKTKLVKDGLYEVFEPVADARYLLAIAFKRAFMIKREQRGRGGGFRGDLPPQVNKQGAAESINLTVPNHPQFHHQNAIEEANGLGSQSHLSIVGAVKQQSNSR